MKIRIAVAVDAEGNWNAHGWGSPDLVSDYVTMMNLVVDSMQDGERRYWLEADIDLPTVPVIQGTVIEA